MNKSDIIRYLVYSVDTAKNKDKEQANKALFIAMHDIVQHKIELDEPMYALIFGDADILGDVEDLGVTPKIVDHLATEYNYADDSTSLITYTMMLYKRILFLYHQLFMDIGHYYMSSTRGTDEAKVLEKAMHELLVDLMRYCTDLFLVTPVVEVGVLEKHFDFSFDKLASVYRFLSIDFTELDFERIAKKVQIFEKFTAGDS